MAVSISFDVIGTMFGYEKVIEAIQKECQEIRDPRAFFFAWFWSTQRDFIYLSVTQAYTPIAKILKATFRRTLDSTQPSYQVTDEQVDRITKSFTQLEARPGLKTALDQFAQLGMECWAVTNGSMETTRGYLEAADVAHHFKDKILSCDDLRVAKTDPKVYEKARSAAHGQVESAWFVASHMWDLKAAKKAGFKTAYLTFEEGEDAGLWEIFDRPDVIAKDYNDLSQKLM